MAEDIKDPRLKKDKRKSRKKTGIILGVLTALSVASMVLFVMITEPKGTVHPSKPKPELTLEQMPLEMLPYSRYLLKTELASLLRGVVQQTGPSRDDDLVEYDEVLWMYDSTTPTAMLSGGFYVYLGRAGGYVWSRMRAGFNDVVPFDPQYMTVNVDGTVYELDIRGDAVHIPLDHVGGAHEYVDLPADQYGDMLRHIGYGEKVFISFRGENGATSFRLNASQRAAVARMMRILRIQGLLDKDAMERLLKTAEPDKEK